MDSVDLTIDDGWLDPLQAPGDAGGGTFKLEVSGLGFRVQGLGSLHTEPVCLAMIVGPEVFESRVWLPCPGKVIPRFPGAGTNILT